MAALGPFESQSRMSDALSDRQFCPSWSQGTWTYWTFGIKSHFAKASFWTYPCTYPETFCITALRAQYAGAIPVVTKYAGLIETVRHGRLCNNTSDYLSTLIEEMQRVEKITIKERWMMREFIWAEYTWSHIAEEWKRHFEVLSL